MNLLYKIFLPILISSIIITLSYTTAIASSIDKVSGKKVMITLDQEDVTPGFRFSVIGINGKRIGIVEIQKIKGKRALGQILKGRAEVGASLASIEESSSAPTKTSARISPTTPTWGVLAGLAMNTMAVKFETPADTANLKGTSFNLLGFYDYPWSRELGIRFWTGLESFTAKGTSSLSSCENTKNCELTVSYLALGGVAKYNFIFSPVKAWAGLMYEYLIPMSKSSNAIADSKIGNNYNYGLASGVDISMGPTSYIPVHVEYGFFSNTATVKATQLILRAGYALKF